MKEKMPKVRFKGATMVPIKDLKAHPKNRNKHPEEQVERLARILDYQGFRYPVKVSNQSGFITTGHGRLLAAKMNGYTHVPVSYQDYDDEAQEYADVQADNAIANWAELDLSGINMDLPELGPDFDIDMLGIEDFTIDPPSNVEVPGFEAGITALRETYANSNIRQLVVILEADSYEQTMTKLMRVRDLWNLETTTAVFLAMLDFVHERIEQDTKAN